MVKFGGEIGTLYQMLKNTFKKHPVQNRTNVQINGGGGQRPFEQCSKKLHFFEMGASLRMIIKCVVTEITKNKKKLQHYCDVCLTLFVMKYQINYQYI